MEYSLSKPARTVFRAYDIRGVIGKDLDENAYYTIGRAFAVRMQAMQRRDVFVGWDGRLTSATLAKALIAGLVSSGMIVHSIGLVTTPVLYYATAMGDEADCGMMITGSHNPAEYNGIKMVLAGKTLVDRDIQALYALVESETFISGVGQVKEQPIIPAYTDRICNDIHLERPLKVVVDCGNGVAGLTAPVIIEALGCEVVPLYCELDGRFPNHHPDPTIESNLSDLKAMVAREKADIGLAFDGDADRLGVITESGELIWPDRLMMFFAQRLLAESPGETIVYDVKCSKYLPEIITASGGEAIMCPTGHSIVKGIMKEKNAALAGEMSGHIFFKHRWFGFDDALYSAARLLEWLSQASGSVSQQFANIPVGIATPEIKIPISEDHKFSFMTHFAEDAQFSDAHILTIDGVRVETEKGWGLLRASNTTPCLVARFEANDEHALHQLQAEFLEQMYAIDEAVAIAFKEVI